MSAAKWPSIPAKGNTLVYEEWVSKFNIWQLDLKDPKHLAKSPTTLVSEKGDKMRPDFSPDGKKIAFESDRLGFWDIGPAMWEERTATGSPHCTAARGAPAGRLTAAILLSSFIPTSAVKLTWSRCRAERPGFFQLFPVPTIFRPVGHQMVSGSILPRSAVRKLFRFGKCLQGGTPVRLTKNGGISPVESPDGQYLYYSKFEQGGVWRMAVQGGEETEVLSEVDGGGWPNWALGSNGIYFLCFGKFPHVSIDLFEFATGKILPLWTLEKEPGWGLSMASNGKSIAYVQNEFAESDIMLVKNFR